MIGFIIYIILIFLSFGLILFVFDNIKKENENDDWVLMEEWKQKEEKKTIKKIKVRRKIYKSFNMDT